MKSKSFMLMILSMGFGLVAAIGISQVMKTSKAAPQQVTKMGPVLVAADILELHAKLNDKNVKIENWPKSIIPENAVTKIEDIEGMVTKMGLAKGMPIVKSSIDSEKNIGKIAIPRGFKVVPIKVGADDILSGLLQPGDNIDIIGYFSKQSPQGTQRVTRTFMKGIKVFNIDNRMTAAGNRSEGKGARSAVVGVLLTEKQAEELFLVQKTADIKLVMSGDYGDGEDETDDISDILNFGNEQMAEAPAQPESLFDPLAYEPAKTTMVIWNGNEPSRFSFKSGELPMNTTAVPTNPQFPGPDDFNGQGISPEFESLDESADSYRGLEQDKYQGE
ncbi:MAG: Flp pilus assembly protein CpaB [Planctomycetota bacterium]